MQYFVYIGRHNKTIELFSKLSTGVFYAAPNCYKATKVLDKIREKYDAALFIEQVELSKDIADIRSIRKMYPGLYMVLVIDSITKEEATEYLKAGVNNTIKYETNSEVLKDLSTFLTRRKEQKIEALQLQTQNLKAFRLPSWKRIFDIFFSGIALLFLSPLLIATAIAIRLESKGPIIYKSKRVGSNYQIFDFLKFRSMYTDADKHLKDFNALNQYQQEEEEEEDIWGEESCVSEEADEEEILLISDDFVISEEDYIHKKSKEKSNAFVKLENDPRITKIGRFIRKYSIDELPRSGCGRCVCHGVLPWRVDSNTPMIARNDVKIKTLYPTNQKIRRTLCWGSGWCRNKQCSRRGSGGCTQPDRRTWPECRSAGSPGCRAARQKGNRRRQRSTCSR